MKHAFITLVTISSAIVACGASSTPPVTTPVTTTSSAAEHSQPAGGHDADHDELPPTLRAFHGVLAPVWHTNPGSGRAEKACANTKTLQDKATAIGDTELLAAVTALEPACAKEGRPEVEAKLTAVHERFHQVAKIEKHEHH